jgi:hypothetical protein
MMSPRGVTELGEGLRTMATATPKDDAADRCAASHDVLYASDGRGPLLRRHYWGLIGESDASPEDVARLVREQFPRFAPPETAVFRREDGADGRPLELGDELNIQIALVGKCRVRVAHVDARSLTLRTLKGHPEAGRITFGADRDEQGVVRFRILSRTRASSWVNYAGFLMLGKQMQSKTWIRFVDEVAKAVGGSVIQAVRVEGPDTIAADASDAGPPDRPTFDTGLSAGSEVDRESATAAAQES